MSNAELAWLMCHLTYTLMAYGLDLVMYTRGGDMGDVRSMQEKIDGVKKLLDTCKRRVVGE